MDVLRDHRRNDLRHDLVGHRVRCNAKTGGHCDHRLHVGDRHRTDFRDVDDRKMGVSHGLRMNVRLGDPNLVVNLSIRNCVLRDPNMDGTTDASLCLRMNDPLDGHLKDDDRHDALVDHRMNATDDLNDLNLDVKMDVSHGLRMNVRLGDQNLDASRVNRRSGVHLNAQLVYEHRVDLTIDPECYVRHDRNLDVNSDVSRGHHTNVTDDRNDLTMVVMMDGSHDRRMNDRLDDH